MVSRGYCSLGLALAFLFPVTKALGDSSLDPCSLSVVSSATASPLPTPLASSGILAPVQEDLIPTDGSFVKSFPVALPHGRRDMAPEVVPIYRSSAANGPLGVGWTLELGTIALSRRHGVTLADPQYELHLPTSASDLILCRDGSYRAQIESAFLRLRRESHGAGSTWTALDRNGTQYVFGPTPESRLSDPVNAAATVQWGLERILDLAGNQVLVAWENDKESIRPIRAAYTGHVDRLGVVDVQPPVQIDLVWEPRPDKIVSYRFGFRQALSYRLQELRVSARGVLQRTIGFAYKRSPSTARSLLTAITTHGADGTPANPITFDYSVPLLALSHPEVAISPPDVPRWSVADATATAVSKASLRYADVDGDGKVDACLLDGAGWQCWRSLVESALVTESYFDNQGLHEYTVTRSEPRFSDRIVPGPRWSGALWRDLTRVAGIRVADLDADGRVDVCALVATGIECWRSPGGAPNSWQQVAGPVWTDAEGWNDLSTGGTVALPDLNGDGLADICGRSRNGILCAIGTGAGFDLPFSGPAWSDAAGWNAPDRYATIAYPDLDGDGGADICARSDSGVVCAAYRDGAFGAPKATAMDWSNAKGWNVQSAFSTIRFADLNGDGVADICGRAPDGRLRCATGTGQDFISTSGALPLTDAEGWGNQAQYGTLQFHDLNHDGLADLCGRSRSGWQCWKGDGDSFIELRLGPRVAADGTGWEEVGRATSLRSVDVAGSGRAYLCGRAPEGPICFPAGGTTWELLDSWENGLGASWELSFSPSTESENLRLPYVIPRLREIVADSGDGVRATVSFEYAGGYMNLQEHDFRGYAWLRVTGPSGPDKAPYRIREFWLHQGDDPRVLDWFYQSGSEHWLFEMTNSRVPLAGSHDGSDPLGVLRGKPYRTLEMDSEQTYYEEHLLTYREDLDGPPYFHPIIRDEAFICEGKDCTFPLERVPGPTFKGNWAEFEKELVRRIKADRAILRFRQSSTQTVTSWTYDALGNVLEFREEGDPAESADDRRTVWTYLNDTQRWHLGRTTTEELLGGRGAGERLLRRTTFQYDEPPVCGGEELSGIGLRTSEARWGRDGQAAVRRFDYDRFGNLTCERDEEGRTQRYEYDTATATVRVAEMNALGHRREYVFNGVTGAGQSGSYGLLSLSRDENGVTARLYYDPLGRLSRVEGQQGTELIEVLDLGDAKRQRVRRLRPTGNWEELRFDGLGRTFERSARGPEGRVLRETVRYDERGILVARTEPHFEGEPPRWTQLERGARGGVSNLIQPGQAARGWCRFARSEVSIDGEGRRTLERSDAFGRTVEVASLEPKPKMAGIPMPPVIAESDSIEELLKSPVPKPCELDKFRTRTRMMTTYRADDLIESVTDASGNRTERTYDLLGRETMTRWPNGRTQKTSYDRSGRVIEMSDARGATIERKYDAIGRVERETRELHGHGEEVSFEYDHGVFGIGRMTQAASPAGRIEWSYDSKGRAIREVHRVDGKEYRFLVDFDADGRPTHQTYPTGFEVFFDYDGPVLVDIRDAVNRLVHFASFTPLLRAREVSFANGVVIGRTFGGDAGVACTALSSQLCGETVRSGGGLLTERTYAFDGSGLIKTIEEGGDRWLYERDGRKQLTKTVWERADGAKTVENFSYDALGSLTRKGGRTIEYGGVGLLPDAARVIDGEVCSYDEDGRLLAWNGHAWSYDFLGRIIGVEAEGDSLSVSYGPTGRLLGSQVNDRSRWRLGDEEECTSEGCVDFVIVGGERLFSRDATGRIEFAAHDHLGSLRLVTDAAGGVVAQYSYDGYGAPSGAGDALDLRRFAGREWFGVLGFSDFGARAYVPELARFLSPDPVRMDRPRPEALNAYAYGANDPVSLVDDGLSPWPAIIRAGVALREYTQSHPAAGNMVEGATKVAVGGGAMFLAAEIANPGLGWSGALLAAEGGAQFAVGISEALSSDQAAEVLERNWDASANLLDPTKIFAGEIAKAMGLERKAGYIGVDLAKVGGGLKGLTGSSDMRSKESLLGISNLILDAKGFIENLSRSKAGQSGEGTNSNEKTTHDPLEHWEPKSSFKGDVIIPEHPWV